MRKYFQSLLLHLSSPLSCTRLAVENDYGGSFATPYSIFETRGLDCDLLLESAVARLLQLS